LAVKGKQPFHLSYQQQRRSIVTNKRMTRPPLLLEDFETARTSAEGTGRRWSSRGEKTYASVEIVSRQTHPHIVRSGERALKFDYDFRYETTEGGSRRAYFNTWAGENKYPTTASGIANDPFALVIPEGEYPTHLGMWVYGDANDAWFNGMLIDADGSEVEVTCGDLEWTGWKFVIMDIPPRFKLPFYVAYPARMLTGSQTIHGTLYIDDIMAVYGGIDFDAVPAEITQVFCRELPGGQPGYPVCTALLVDPDDEENGCAASGIDPGRTKVTIDGIRHTNNIIVEPSDKHFKLTLTPDFALCGGPHRLDITAFDRAGNKTRVRQFFNVLAREPGVYFAAEPRVEFGGRLSCRLAMRGALKNTKISFALQYDSELLTLNGNFLTPAPGVTATAGDDNGRVCVELDTGENMGDFELASLNFTAASALDSVQNTVLVCQEAQLTYDGKAEPFCFADAEVSIEPGLCLRVERLCRGYDTVFTVTDKQGQPVEGAKVCERRSGIEYPGETDAQGHLTVPGITDGDVGTKLDFYARKAGRFSLTARYAVSVDPGFEHPVNLNVTCGKDCSEVTVSWQTGVALTEGFFRCALKTPGKTEWLPGEPVLAAERRNSFSTWQSEPGEVNGYCIRLAGLAPGAEYLYQIGYGNQWGETKVFKTIPVKGDFSFAVLADTHDVCGEAMRAALKCEPGLSFFAHAGDFVSAGGVFDDWLAYFGDAGGLHALYPTLGVIGNHDLSDGTGENYRLTHVNPANGPQGAPDGLFYYTELNNTLFISAAGGYGDDRVVMDWMSEIIRGTAMKWKIVLTHEGPYTCFINSATEEIKWGDFFNTVGIDMLISGHDHTFQRATIKDRNTLDVGPVISSSSGVTYLQCATSGGASNHDWAQHRDIWNAVYDSKTPSVSILSVSDDKIAVRSLCVADNEVGFEVFDSFEMGK